MIPENMKVSNGSSSELSLNTKVNNANIAANCTKDRFMLISLLNPDYSIFLAHDQNSFHSFE